MKFEIITLFPDYFTQSLAQSLLGKAQSNRLFDISIIQLRDFAIDKHRTVDDTPAGGGGGMVLKVEPLDRCLQSLGYQHKKLISEKNTRERIILTSAAGLLFNQERAISYSLCERVTMICGHYLGVDERILELYDIDEVSIGDYVLTGGEPAAAVMVDAIARLIPKVLGNFQSALQDSHIDDIVGTPVYTRPAEYAGIEIPAELQSGNHAVISAYRRSAALRKCRQNRPDLLERAPLDEKDRKSLSTEHSAAEKKR
jgi:tRNA (guanine37-N1)-methyltransferase